MAARKSPYFARKGHLLKLVTAPRGILASLLNTLLTQYERAEVLLRVSIELPSDEDIPMDEPIIESSNSEAGRKPSCPLAVVESERDDPHAAHV